MNPKPKKWYVFLTKPRHEKRVFERLTEKGFESYLPLQTVVKKWSDRKKKVEEPLFKSYIFVNMIYKERVRALETDGVARLVTFNGHPGTVHETEIDAIRWLVDHTRIFPDSYLEITDEIPEGSPVEITAGPMTGLRGILVDHRNRSRFCIKVENLGKTLMAELPADILKPVLKT